MKLSVFYEKAVILSREKNKQNYGFTFKIMKTICEYKCDFVCKIPTTI